MLAYSPSFHCRTRNESTSSGNSGSTESAGDNEFKVRYNWKWFCPPPSEVSHAEDLILLTCCKPVVKNHLAIGHGSRRKEPVFVPFKCIMEENGAKKCESCGIDLVLEKCPALRNYNKEIMCNEWQSVNIERTEQTQQELRPVKEPFNEITRRLIEDLKTGRIHYVRYRWSNWGAKREVAMGPLDFIIDEDSSSESYGALIPNPNAVRVVHTDFAAIGSLTPAAKDNSHVDTHFINDVFMLFSRWEYWPILKDSPYPECEGWLELDVKLLPQCDVYEVIGATDKTGVKQGHVYHNASLKSILLRDDEKRRQLNEPQVSLTTVRTDRCPTQYICQQNYLRLAENSAGDEISGALTHKAAEKYNYKGQHDREGKDTKDSLKTAELKGKRIPKAKVSYT